MLSQASIFLHSLPPDTFVYLILLQKLIQHLKFLTESLCLCASKWFFLFVCFEGLLRLLVPWIDEAEKTTNSPLEKPTSFDHAREVEAKCVKFAKVSTFFRQVTGGSLCHFCSKFSLFCWKKILNYHFWIFFKEAEFQNKKTEAGFNTKQKSYEPRKHG